MRHRYGDYGIPISATLQPLQDLLRFSVLARVVNDVVGPLATVSVFVVRPIHKIANSALQSEAALKQDESHGSQTDESDITNEGYRQHTGGSRLKCLKRC